MIVAITGGTGFIGRNLLDLHLKLGDKVKVLTRKSLENNKNVKYFYGNLSDPKIDLYEFVNDIDIFYHCAGEIKNKLSMYELHVNGTQKLVNVAKGRIKRWVQLSSVGAYGPCRSKVIDETALLQPQGIYEETKVKADNIVINSGIPYVILRPSNVFGMNMPNQSLYQLINMIKKGNFFYIGKKGALVNFINVDDVVKALYLCGTHKNSLGKIYNLSQTITLENMISSFLLGLGIEKKFKRLPESPIRLLTKLFEVFPSFPLTTSRIDALTNRCSYNSNKIISELGFKFKYKLEESFQFIARQK